MNCNTDIQYSNLHFFCFNNVLIQFKDVCYSFLVMSSYNTDMNESGVKCESKGTFCVFLTFYKYSLIFMKIIFLFCMNMCMYDLCIVIFCINIHNGPFVQCVKIYFLVLKLCIYSI